MEIYTQEKSVPGADALPYRGTPFFGREKEIDEISNRISQPDCRLLTLIGPGGTGKTRLAVEAAVFVKEQFPDGVYFVNLETIDSADFLVHAVAVSLQLYFSGQGDPVDQILAYLRDKNLLLVLDNFEHLIDRAELVAELIQNTAFVKILVTSRSALNLLEEHLYPVSGIPYPNSAAGPYVDFARYPAVALFAASARRVRPDLDLEAEREGVLRICRAVEGMPLALELAASWTKVMNCNEIADEIQKNISFLASGLRNVPEKHRSIQAVFRRSWEILDDEQRTVFAHLSVFQGGFKREAARDVGGASLAVLSTLVDQSFLRRVKVEGADRYQIHELLRQNAAERLAESPEEVWRVRSQHSSYYMSQVYKLEKLSNNGEQEQAMVEMKAEYENIRAAWLWASEQGLAEEILKANAMMHLFYQITSRYVEGSEMFEKAVLGLELHPPTPESRLALAQALNGAAWFAIRLGRINEGEQATKSSTALYAETRQTPSPGVGTDPLAPLAVIAQVRGDYDQVIALARKIIRGGKERGDLVNMALANYALAGAYLALGQYEHAREHAQDGYQQAKDSNNRWFMAYCLIEWGNAARLIGDLNEANLLYETAYSIREAFDDPEGMAIALNHLGKIALLQEHFSEAWQLYQQARALYEKISDRGGMARTLHGLCQAAAGMGDTGRARRMAAAALRTAQEIGFFPQALAILTTVGNLYLGSQQTARGNELLAYVARHPQADHETHKRAASLLGKELEDAALAADSVIPETGAGLSSVIETVLHELLLQPMTDVEPEEPLQQGEGAAPAAQPGLVEPLTEREIEILRALAEGMTNQEIAASLILSLGTVKWYTSQIYGKLGVKSRTQAIARARELEIL